MLQSFLYIYITGKFENIKNLELCELSFHIRLNICLNSLLRFYFFITDSFFQLYVIILH